LIKSFAIGELNTESKYDLAAGPQKRTHERELYICTFGGARSTA
jgi:hypothetical protein